MRALFALVLALQTAIPMTTVARGTTSQILQPRQSAVQSQGDWAALWREHTGQTPPAPSIDFARFTVAALFIGERPTAGYSVEITAATTRNGDTILDYVERVPAADAITAQVITSPFHIVRIPKTTGRVVFRRATP